jgi:hypothetical protein
MGASTAEAVYAVRARVHDAVVAPKGVSVTYAPAMSPRFIYYVVLDSVRVAWSDVDAGGMSLDTHSSWDALLEPVSTELSTIGVEAERGWFIFAVP